MRRSGRSQGARPGDDVPYAGAVSDRPSPLERLASAAVRALGALPPAAQRRLGGRPIEIEDARLEPEVQLYLRLLALDPRPPLEGLSVAEAADRVGYRSEAAFARAFKRTLGFAPGASRTRAATPPEPAWTSPPMSSLALT